MAPCCSIVPPALLKHIVSHPGSSDKSRAAAQKTLNHVCKLTASRRANPQGIAPPKSFLAQAASSGGAKTVYRELYTSEKTDTIDKKLLFKEGVNLATVKDTDAKNVYQYFGDTYQFYSEVFKRNSVDNKGLHLVGSVHYDDEPGPPGMDNAFWDGKEMAFGDGDDEIFGSFTHNIDVIGHELTHGVTQYTAQLEYEYQAGALNESLSDVFGSMIKQYFGGPNGTKQTADEADWLIGEGIFLPSITNAKALRSMKAPGTAYDNPSIGKDTQPSTMDGYVDLPNTDQGDEGGVHTNSGIPNHAFYLAATSLGGYSWDKAGPIWYAAMNDKKMHGIDTKAAFKIFADLTVSYAGSMFDADTQAKVQKAWADVKVLEASASDSKI